MLILPGRQPHDSLQKRLFECFQHLVDFGLAFFLGGDLQIMFVLEAMCRAVQARDWGSVGFDGVRWLTPAGDGLIEHSVFFSRLAGHLAYWPRGSPPVLHSLEVGVRQFSLALPMSIHGLPGLV